MDYNTQELQLFISDFYSRSGVGFCVLDTDGKIAQTNEFLVTALGYLESSILGKHIDDLLNFRIFNNKEIELPHTVERELRTNLSSSTVKIFRMTFFSDGSTDTIQYVIFIDITEYVRIEKTLWNAMYELEESRKTQSRFLANVNHELRTPLNSILGITHLLLDSDISSEFLPRLNKIKLSALHLLQIFDDLLGIKDYGSRLESTGVEERFQLDAVLSETLPLPISEIVSGRVSFQLYRDPAIPDYLEGPSLFLGRILQSLVGNAVKYTESGTIDVSIHMEEEEPPSTKTNLIVEVKDTGPGIRPEYLSKLFTPFSQEDSSSTRKYGGLGLGLAVARNFARASGGDISVESRSGKGSTFRLRMPVRPALEQEDPAFLFFKQRRPLILGIVDNDQTGEIIKEYTEYAGGIALLRKYEEIPYDPTGELRPDVALLMICPSRPMNPDILSKHLKRLEENQIPAILWNVDKFKSGPTEQHYGDLVARVQGVFLPLFFYRRLHQMLTSGPGSVGTLPFFKDARILVVEDNIINQEVVGGILKKRGILPLYASSGEAALTLLEEDPEGYDLVLMDIQMPGMNGIETCRRIRKSDGKYFAIPVVALTANTDLVDREECLLAGMQGYLVKPVDPPVLFQTIAGFIPRRVLPEPEKKERNFSEPVFRETSDKKRVDLSQGLERTFGDTDLFERVILQFESRYVDFEKELEKLMQMDDEEGAIRMAHSLKGVAANLGLLETQEHARELELILREKSEGDWREAASLTGVALEYAMEQLREWRESGAVVEQEPASDPENDFSEMFQRVQHSIAENDVSAVVIVRQFPPARVPRAVEKKWDSLVSSLRVFDFETARSLIKEISDILL